MKRLLRRFLNQIENKNKNKKNNKIKFYLNFCYTMQVEFIMFMLKFEEFHIITCEFAPIKSNIV